MEFKTIKELYDAVKSGKIDESKLLIVLDNDMTSFIVALTENGVETSDDITVKEANGYMDIDKLYPLLFPKATVEWC